MTGTHQRIEGLDAARGAAILGTLATNIWIFGHPGGLLGYLADPTIDGAPTWHQQVEAVLQQLANGKFLGLLTLMFGIGLAIQADAAARRGHRWPGPYPWRAALLLLDGLVHYLLVVEFDVLMGYAVTGAVVAYILATSDRAQRWWIGICASLHVALVALLTAAMLTAPDEAGLTIPQPTANPYRDGTWWDLVLLRIDYGMLFRFEPVFMLLLGIALFTLGGRLYRAGLFTPRGAGLRRRLMVVGALAFPIDLALGLASPDWLFLTRYVLAPCVALGLLALIAEVTGRGPIGPAGRALARLGRVALSGYVLQNILASILFYGWGLNLGGVPPAWHLPVTVAGGLLIGAIVLALAHVWLRHFPRGPLEALWSRSYRALAGPDAHDRPKSRA